MKKITTSLLVLLMMAVMPSFAQQTFDKSQLLGTWSFENLAEATGDEDVDISATVTFAENNVSKFRFSIFSEELDGKINFTFDGTYTVGADSVMINPDIQTLALKYVGNNKEMENMINQLIQSQKEAFSSEATEQLGKLTSLHQVKIEGDTLTYVNAEGKEEKLLRVKND